MDKKRKKSVKFLIVIKHYLILSGPEINDSHGDFAEFYDYIKKFQFAGKNL